MQTKTTQGVQITVKCIYLPSASNPRLARHMFAYKITIKNNNDYSVQLLRRRWDIFDSIGEYRTVEGEGVVGETPVIEPGNSYSYSSSCDLSTEIGKMSGIYVMLNLVTNQEFEVVIPEFYLIAEGKMN